VYDGGPVDLVSGVCSVRFAAWVISRVLARSSPLTHAT